MMKKITKGNQPGELLQWRKVNNDIPENLGYGLAGFPRPAVLASLLIEQGYICAYTLISINENAAHVEHLKPQSICRQEDENREGENQKLLHEDVKWCNIVACFPEPRAEHPGYGAVEKGNWWSCKDFVSPISEDCESKFRYCKNGAIQEAINGDIAAKKTIEELKLDCDPLKELRFKAIKATGFHKRSKNPIMSIEKVERIINQLQQKREGKYTQFCVVLEHAGLDYIEELKKRANRKRN